MNERINDVLADFHDWGRPWEFIRAVLAHQGLQQSEIATINALWTTATDAKYWVEPSLKTAEELIREKLRNAYPWLNKRATDSLIRGASYIWK